MKLASICLRWLAACFVTLGLALIAGEALAQRMKPVIELELYTKLFDAPEKNGVKNVTFLVINEGLLDGVLAVHAAFAKAGAPPRICMKPGVEFDANIEFVSAVGEELTANEKTYESLNAVDMGVVALYAMKRRFPCR